MLTLNDGLNRKRSMYDIELVKEILHQILGSAQTITKRGDEFRKEESQCE